MVISRLLTILFVILASAASLQAAEVYKNVDESGKVEYSDQAEPGAEAVTIEQTNTVKATPVPAFRPKEHEPSATPGFSIAITSPADQQMFPNRLAAITVTTVVKPGLKEGFSERLLVDGEAHSTGHKTFTINGISVGEHTLQVELVSKEGKVKARSDIITIFARQPG